MTNELKRVRDALASIAYRPLGGKTEDYLCSARIQADARKALATLDRLLAKPSQPPAALNTIRAALTAKQPDVNAELLEALKMAKTIIGHPDDEFSKYISELITRTEQKG